MFIRTKEIEIIQEYINNNPYPEYSKILKEIENNLSLWNDYSFDNHKYCKNIYNNFNNKELILINIKNIYKNGIQTLQNCNSILKYYSPFSKSGNQIIRKYPNIIENYFQEIGLDWDYQAN